MIICSSRLRFSARWNSKLATACGPAARATPSSSDSVISSSLCDALEDCAALDCAALEDCVALEDCAVLDCATLEDCTALEDCAALDCAALEDCTAR